MTERINCVECNFVLYWGETIKDRMGIRYSEDTFLARYEHKCPNCGGKVTTDSVKITFED
ncbi:MAG: hypothetical protein QG670_2250 [Thermoproteota archaeon]|nr:hypothetical protein [Thermoproteota archaeon]